MRVFRHLLVLLMAAGCGPRESAPRSDGASDAALAPSRPVTRPVMRAEPRDPLPDGFVYLRDVDPTILQEMRYATAYNFVGERIDGYDEAECVLTEEAARALAQVQADLRPRRLSLKVYDCYRPQRAVVHFVRWIRLVDRPGYEGDDEAMKEAFFPAVEKRRLFREGYIARRSGHSRGSTVDLTVVRLPHAPRTTYPQPPGRLPRCDAPAVGGPGGRLDEGDLDMGTAYDCFTPLSMTDSPDVSSAARANRRLLRDAMSRRGFRNYPQEWWHFTLRGEPYSTRYFDFVIGAD
jgi:D-alanyl-D-alanine dipeptidase